VSAFTQTDLVRHRTVRSELRRRSLRRYAWFPQTVGTDHPNNEEAAPDMSYLEGESAVGSVASSVVLGAGDGL